MGVTASLHQYKIFLRPIANGVSHINTAIHITNGGKGGA